MEYYKNNDMKNESVIVKQEKINTKKPIYLGDSLQMSTNMS